MSNKTHINLNIDDLNMEIKLLKDATHISLIELEKNIKYTYQTISQFDTRLKQLENSMKFIHNTFQKTGNNIDNKCDN